MSQSKPKVRMVTNDQFQEGYVIRLPDGTLKRGLYTLIKKLPGGTPYHDRFIVEDPYEEVVK